MQPGTHEMPALHFHLSRRARGDLDEIAEFLKQRSPQAARRVLYALLDTFLTLARNPQMGARRDDLRQHLRMFTPSRPAASYVVFYYHRSYGVEISDVIHASRDWPQMFTSGKR